MIIEYFKYLTNPATKSAKKLGQLQEAIAMEARYKRSQLQWEPHLKNTKLLIEESSRQVIDPNELIVLGSGLLLDTPIEFLAKYFERVYLIDVVHLKKIKKNINKFNNVFLIEHDVTGLADQIIETTKTSSNDFQPKASIPKLSADTSLVISANMLSQLHYSPVKFVTNTLGYDEKKQKKLTKEIMLSHIQMLSQLTCRVCLITDYKRNYKDERQHIIEQEEALPGIKLPKPDKEWLWEIAPKGELSKNISLTSVVYGYQDFKQLN